MIESLTFEEHVALVEKRLEREPRYRLALYRLLEFCEQPQTLEAIDEAVGAYPEMAVSPFTSRSLLRWLTDPEAIVAVDEEGNPLAAVESDDDGAADEASAEAATPRFYQLSVVGEQVLDNYRHSNPIGTLFAQLPQYEAAFLKVLENCRQPKTRKEVEALFEGDPILTEPKRVYPNMFLDKLERVGALIFKERWATTPEGIDFLENR